jgi:hypothetical protein
MPGGARAAGDPEATQRCSTERARPCSAVPRATREWSSETHPQLPLRRSPPPEYFTPTRDIHARARRWNVHVKRQKSRVERLPIRPLRTPALKHQLVRTPTSTFWRGCRSEDAAAALGRPAASTIASPLGRVAQWESARFTRERSQVRNPPRPLETPGFRAAPLEGPVPIGAKTPPSVKAFSRARSSSEKRMACA